MRDLLFMARSFFFLMDIENFSMMMAGRGKKSEYGKLLGIALIIFIVFLSIAQLVFPGGYSPFDFSISTQGGMADNPPGWYFFTIGVAISGLLIIPVVNFCFENLPPHPGLLVKAGRFFSLIGMVGFIFVGLIPHDYAAPHNLAANIAFGGLGFGAFLVFVLLLVQMKRGISNKPKWAIVVMFGPIIVIGILSGLASLYAELLPTSPFDNRFANYPIWQWSSMISLLIYIAAFFFFTKERPKDA